MKKLIYVLVAAVMALLCSCDGTGSNGSSGSGVRICDNCAGNGKYTCRNCNGCGGIYNANGSYNVCPLCAGYGVVTCGKCDGRGTVAVF